MLSSHLSLNYGRELKIYAILFFITLLTLKSRGWRTQLDTFDAKHKHFIRQLIIEWKKKKQWQS
jgi:hypothetical protein